MREGSKHEKTNNKGDRIIKRNRQYDFTLHFNNGPNSRTRGQDKQGLIQGCPSRARVGRDEKKALQKIRQAI